MKNQKKKRENVSQLLLAGCGYGIGERRRCSWQVAALQTTRVTSFSHNFQEFRQCDSERGSRGGMAAEDRGTVKTCGANLGAGAMKREIHVQGGSASDSRVMEVGNGEYELENSENEK